MITIYLCDPALNPRCRKLERCFFANHNVTPPEGEKQAGLIAGFASVCNECCTTLDEDRALRYPDGSPCIARTLRDRRQTR